MDLPRLVFSRERAGAHPSPQMIVVGAQQRVGLRERRGIGRRQVTHDVEPRSRLTSHLHVDRELDVGQRKSRHVRVPGVEAPLHIGDLAIRYGREQRFHNIGADANGNHPGAAGRIIEPDRNCLSGIGRSRSGNDDQRLGSAIPSRQRLVTERGVPRQDPRALPARRPQENNVVRRRPCP